MVSVAAAMEVGRGRFSSLQGFSEEAGAGNMPRKVEFPKSTYDARSVSVGGIAMMEMDRFQNAVIAELAAFKYIVEQIGEIAFLVATMRPEHAAAMRQRARKKADERDVSRS